MPSPAYDYPFAHGPLQVALAILAHPLSLMAAVATPGRLTYALEALAPLVFLPLRTWWIFAALPGSLVVLLANDPLVYHMGFHYALLWVPWVLLAAAWALVGLRERRGEPVAVRWWRAAVAACAVTLLAFNPMHPFHYLAERYTHSRDVDLALACIPHGALVATHDEWFAHIAGRYPRATALDMQEPDDALVFSSTWPNAYFQRIVLPKVRKAVAAGRYRLLCRFGDVQAYRRVPGHS